MNDYSDLIFLVAAMVLLSMLTLNTSRKYLTQTDSMVRAEFEYRAIATAQDEIDSIRWVERAENLDSADVSYIFSSFPENRTITFGNANQFSETVRIDASTTVVEDNFQFIRYLVTLSVSNNALNPPVNINMNYIKTFRK